MLLLYFINVLLLVNFTTAEPSVIIVGAGAAGIAAYSKLYSAGFKNILILEAEARIGGRVHTVEFGDSIVDLGGEWCHGQEGNIVWKLASDYNVLGPSHLDFALVNSKEPEFDKTTNDQLYEIFEHIWDENGDVNSTVGETMGDYFMPRYVYIQNSLLIKKIQRFFNK